MLLVAPFCKVRNVMTVQHSYSSMILYDLEIIGIE